MSSDVLSNEEVKSKRSFLLSLLCILSFIYCVVAALFVIAVVFFMGDSILVDGAYFSVLIAIGIIALNFVSVILLWRMKRLGFYLYVLTNIIFTSIQIYLTQEVTWMTILVPVLLIGLFATQFKKLR